MRKVSLAVLSDLVPDVDENVVTVSTITMQGHLHEFSTSASQRQTTALRECFAPCLDTRAPTRSYARFVRWSPKDVRSLERMYPTKSIESTPTPSPRTCVGSSDPALDI